MNYHLVGKELTKDRKLLSQSPWDKNIILEAVCLIDASFRQRGPENQEDARKKIPGGGQNPKDHWSLA